MLDRIITHSDLRALVDELARKRRIFGPVARSVPEADPPVRYFYEEMDSAEDLDLGFTYCVYSPKRFLMPPVETLFTFAKQEGRFTTAAMADDRPSAIVGVHPCDLHAIRLLDTVFSKNHRDEHYLSRRANTLLVGVDCATPCTEGVFCKDTGTNEAQEGCDVMLYPLSGQDSEAEDQGRYGVVFGTTEGREWLLYSRRCSVPSAADERMFEQYQAAKTAAFPRQLKTPFEEMPELLRRSYDSLLWEATGRRCYSCGSCNLSCPTCYCFDIHDETELGTDSGARLRDWDGCHLPNFALVAGDHNFRPQAASRLRHRIFRKGAWIREQNEVTGCVGCARCDRACTAKINSVEIYNQLAEEV